MIWAFENLWIIVIWIPAEIDRAKQFYYLPHNSFHKFLI